MHPSRLLRGVLLAALASATPHSHRNHEHHKVNHASISGQPFPLGNSTRVLLATASGGHHLSFSTTTEYVTSTILAYETPSPGGDSVKDKEADEEASAASDACEAVTVTYNPTVTITALPSGSQSTPTIENPSQILASSAAYVEPGAPKESAAATSILPFSSPAEVSSDSASTPSSTPAVQIGNVNSQALSLLPSSTQSTESQPIPTSNNGGISTKRGIIASGSDQKLLVGALGTFEKISWLGDWYSGPPTNLPSSIEFVPQNYGRQSDVNGEWTSNAKKAVAAGDKYFLSFGEPGTPNAQLYMDPQDAVTLFMQKMQPYAEQGVSIGAPGTLQNDQDFAWLSSFLDLCDKAGCKIGFLAMHWFWTAETDHVQGFKDTLTKNVALAKGKPVWVDNFQAAGSMEDQMDFLKEVVPWLDSQEDVARYAYVPVDRGNGQGFLNDGDGTLSELGKLYASL